MTSKGRNLGTVIEPWSQCSCHSHFWEVEMSPELGNVVNRAVPGIVVRLIGGPLDEHEDCIPATEVPMWYDVVDDEYPPEALRPYNGGDYCWNDTVYADRPGPPVVEGLYHRYVPIIGPPETELYYHNYDPAKPAKDNQLAVPLPVVKYRYYGIITPEESLSRLWRAK